MDEQFSQAYKDFMRSDEAKGLQALWVPGVGDFIWCGEQGFYGLWIIVPRSEDNSPFGLAGLDHSGFFGVFSDLDELRPFVRGIGVWLPSLSQLLGIIEGAGWDWKAERYHTRVSSQARYWVYAQNHALELYEDEICTDVMLAAAKVAARAVEGKG